MSQGSEVSQGPEISLVYEKEHLLSQPISKFIPQLVTVGTEFKF